MFLISRFARATGQRWKYVILLGTTVVALVLTLAHWSLWNGNPAHLPGVLTGSLYFAVGIFWFVWWAAAIRCPSCGIRVGWYHMNHGSSQDAIARILMTETCPACGFTPVAVGSTATSDEQGTNGTTR
jgi:hypothetical protein